MRILPAPPAPDPSGSISGSEHRELRPLHPGCFYGTKDLPNPLRIRTSKTLLPQPLYNPHLHRSLGCAGNKRLTGTRIHRQLFCNEHLRTPLRSAGNTGLIILLESALTKNAPATLLESALPKNRGEGAEMSNSDQARYSLNLPRSNVPTFQRYTPTPVHTPAPACYP
jgi:hypothetical protein